MAQILFAAGNHRYWYTDSDRQYQGWKIPNKSPDTLAIWTPLGLFRPKQLQFGETNAGIITRGAVKVMIESDQDAYTRCHMINGADSFTGFADHKIMDGKVEVDWWGLTKSFIAMVEMASKNDMSLKTSNMCFGLPRADFEGYTLSKDGQRSAIHNLASIKRIVAPSNVSETRRVLGLMVQHMENILM